MDLTEDWFLNKVSMRPLSVSNGFVDRLQDFKRVSTELVPEGIKDITIKFTHEVQKVGGGPLDPSCFTVTSTCPTAQCTLPVVQSVTQNSADSRLYTVTLSPQALPAHWTVIQANSNLQGTGGQVMRSDPWDRVELGFLPGDTNANGTVNAADHDRLVDVLQGQYPPDLLLHDINRDGTINAQDNGRLTELLHGVNTTQVWNNYSLPPRP